MIDQFPLKSFFQKNQLEQNKKYSINVFNKIKDLVFQSLEKNNFIEIEYIWFFKINFNQTQFEEIVSILIEHLRTITNTILDNTKSQNLYNNTNIFNFISSIEFTNYLNNLPIEFDDTIEKYGLAVKDFVNLLKNSDKKTAYEMLFQLNQVNKLGNYKKEIFSSLIVLENDYLSSETSNDSSFNWRNILIILSLIFFLMRILRRMS